MFGSLVFKIFYLSLNFVLQIKFDSKTDRKINSHQLYTAPLENLFLLDFSPHLCNNFEKFSAHAQNIIW